MQDNKIIFEAIDKAYKYLSKKGYFTTPTDEARELEIYLIKARIMANQNIYVYMYPEEDLKKAYSEGTNKGARYQSLINDEDWDAVKYQDENPDVGYSRFLESLKK